MDDVDRSILAVLEKHGRISNAELAAQVGLSPSPCLRRVRRLEETGVIRGYRTLIDPAAIGRGLRVFAGVRLVRHARADVVAFERAVIRLPEVVHTHHVTGNYDYLLQVEVADLAAYEDFHANRLASLPGVAMVTSYVTMKTLSPGTARPAGRRRLERPPTYTRRTSVQIIPLTGTPVQVTRHVKHRPTHRLPSRTPALLTSRVAGYSKPNPTEEICAHELAYA